MNTTPLGVFPVIVTPGAPVIEISLVILISEVTVRLLSTTTCSQGLHLFTADDKSLQGDIRDEPHDAFVDPLTLHTNTKSMRRNCI